MSANEHLEPRNKVAAPSSSLPCSTQSGSNTSATAETSTRLSPPPARSFRARSPSEITITTDPEVLRSGYRHVAANRTSVSPSQRPTPGPSQPTLEDTAPSMGIRGVDSTVDDHTPSITGPRAPAAEPSSSATHATHGGYLSPDLRREGSNSRRQRTRSRQDTSLRAGATSREGTTSEDWSTEDQRGLRPSRSLSSHRRRRRRHYNHEHVIEGEKSSSASHHPSWSDSSHAPSSASATSPRTHRPQHWPSDLEPTGSPKGAHRRRHPPSVRSHKMTSRPVSQMSLPERSTTPAPISTAKSGSGTAPSSPIRSILSHGSLRLSRGMDGRQNDLEQGTNRRSFSLRRLIRGMPSKEAEIAAAQSSVAAGNDEETTVISRHMSSYRVVHMLYQTDADLFDAIKEWKEAHPDRWVDDAIDAFASAKGADALAHLVYSTEAFDIVLKYTASKQDIAPIFNGYKSNKQQSQRTPTSPTALSPISPDNMTPMENVDQISPPKLVDKEKERVVIGIHQDRVPTGEPLQRDTSKSLRSRSRLFELRESPKQLLRRALSLQSSTIVKHWRLPATSITAEQTKQGGVLHPLPRSESSAPKVLFSSEDAPPKPLGIPPIPKMEPLELPGSENVEIHPYIVPTKTTSTGMKALDNACISFQDIVYGPMNEAEALAKGVIKPHQPQEDDIQPLPSFKSQLESEKCSNPSGGGASSSTTRPAIPPRKGSGYSAAGTSASSRRRKSKKKRRTKIRRERPSKAKMREWKIQLHRRQYQLALLREGLFIELEKSIHSDAVYVKVLAPFWRLVDEAQKTMCKADLANTMLPSIPFASRLFPNIGRLFPCLLKSGLEQHRESVLFKKSRLHEYYLAEMNRRWSDVVRHSGALGPTGKHIGNNHGSDGRPGFFMTSRRGYLVHSIMMRTESQNVTNNRKLGLRSALRRGAYQKLFALHDGPFKLKHRPTNEVNVRAQLHHKWAKRFCGNHPLDTVVSYYGERIGVYFAWWAHYTRWLTIPAAVGLMVFVFGIINAANQNRLDVSPNVLFAIFDNVLTMPFALFMSLWSTIYIEFWKRANKFYAYRWHMLDYERVELPRTEFRATRVRTSPVTGKKELYYPSYWKLLRIMGSSAATVMAISVSVGCVACLMIFTAWCRNHISSPYGPVVAAAILNLIIIIILAEIWCRLAEWLTDKENHKYTDSYDDSLIMKRYLFDFTNMYGTLFYYAFFKAPFGTKVFPLNPDLQDKCLYDACITELSVQLAVVFIGKQFLNGMFEMVFPWIKRTWNRKRILADQALKRKEWLERRKQTRTPQWIKDDDLPSYDGRILKCYRKTVIQFGFCTLFVTSFPVAPAFALINNLIDLRMEAFRLLTQYRRPIAFRAQDIGVWEKIMEFISFTSVITNAAIIAFSSLWVKQNIFVDYLHATTEGELLAARLGFILVFEHVVFLFKVILRSAIPTVPLPIKLAVQRSKYMNRVAQEGLDSEQDEDLDETDSEEDEEDEYLSDGEMSDTENDDDDEDNGDDDESDQSSVVSGEDGSDTFESSNRFFDPECPECVSSSSMPTGPRTTTAVGDDGPRTLQPSDNKGESSRLPWKRKISKQLDIQRDSIHAHQALDNSGKKSAKDPYKQRHHLYHHHHHHHHHQHRRPVIQHQQYSIRTIAEERSLTAEDQQPQGSTTIDSDWMVLDNLNQLV